MKTLFLTIAAPFLATLPSIAQDTVYTRTDGPIDGQVTAIIQGNARVEIGNQTLTIRAADIDSILINDEARKEAENFNKKSLRNHAFTFYVGGTLNNGDIFFGGLDLRAGWKPTPLNNVGIGITFGRVDTSDSNDDYSMTSDFEFCGPDLIYARPPYSYYDFDYEYTTCAIYAHARHDFLPRTASPFVELRVGILPESNADKVAFYGGFTGGIRIALRHASILWGIGATVIGAHEPAEPSRHVSSGHGAVNMNLGVEF